MTEQKVPKVVKLSPRTREQYFPLLRRHLARFLGGRRVPDARVVEYAAAIALGELGSAEKGYPSSFEKGVQIGLFVAQAAIHRAGLKARVHLDGQGGLCIVTEDNTVIQDLSRLSLDMASLSMLNLSADRRNQHLQEAADTLAAGMAQ